HLIELFLLHVVGIDFEQQIGATLQVEAGHDMPLRPERPRLYSLLRKEIRNREQADDQRRQNDRQRFPPREKKHRVDPSDPGKYAAAGGVHISSWTSRPWPRPS